MFTGTDDLQGSQGCRHQVARGDLSPATEILLSRRINFSVGKMSLSPTSWRENSYHRGVREEMLDAGACRAREELLEAGLRCQRNR